MVKKVLKYTLVSSIIFASLIFLFLWAVYSGIFGKLPTTEELKEFKNASASVVVADNGKLLGKYYKENRILVNYKQLPQSLINALVATEDARYFEHEGVDSQSLIRVLFKTILFNDRSSGGGSTINQQLVKNMYGRKDYGPLTMIINKSKEGFLAYRLEKIYNKEDILTLYLNTVPFGEDVMGIASAGRRYFNKPVNKLKAEESAVLIGMLKANTYYNPRLHPENALKRRNVVLNQMEKYDYFTKEQTDSLKALPLKLDYANLTANGPANYFIYQIKDEVLQLIKSLKKEDGSSYNLYQDGLKIETTLDYNLQKSGLKAFNKHLKKMQGYLNKQYSRGVYSRQLAKLATKEYAKIPKEKLAKGKKNRNVFNWNGYHTDSISQLDSIQHSLKLLHAGLLALDPKTGAVKTWVGGIDYNTFPYDQIYAQRQVASTFKPILYATALEMGKSPCDYLNNEPITLTDFSNWQPQNYNGKSGGKYSMAAALAKSLNIPTIHLFINTPFSMVESTWQHLGFSQPLTEKPSTALGTANASIYELAIAYAAFANGGFKIIPQAIKKITDANGNVLYENKKLKHNLSKRIISNRTSQLITTMLEKAVKEGTGTALRNKYNITIPLAGKTGTSQDYADAWFVAYNPKIIMVSRVGTTFPAIKFNSGKLGSGSALALPLVAQTLKTQQQKYNYKFNELTEDDKNLMACEDFKEISDMENFFQSIFKSNKTSYKKKQKRAERKNKRQAKRKKNKKKTN
ncbi:MAG: penicillin-binding protein [Flavobacteriales bacterium]|nr:MAG: penicillin-binding protein [Flavobacteriales bacterium]